MNPIKKTFEEYDNENPEIWKSFEAKTLQLIKMGRTHYGAKAITEVIRYETIVEGNDEFKLNNNYTAGYARKFMTYHPSHKRFFETREQKTMEYTL